jgi:alpha-tubulin suppressor-like RCC1 family protein
MNTPLGKFSLAIVGLALTFNLQPPTVLAGPAVTSIACGFAHSLFSKSDGSLWVMGYNLYGQLGIGFTPQHTNLPVQVLSSGVQRVAAGAYHSLYISGGSLWVMGYNAYGQLGDGTTNNHVFPEKIFAANFSARATVIAAGHYHSLFGTSSGVFVANNDLYAMGANGAGELGDGTFTVHYSAEQVRSSTSISAVAAGEGHSLFIKSDGSLWGMGDNTSGQLGIGSMPETNIQVEIVSSGVTAVAAGYSHSLFIKSDGSLWAMGSNAYDQLGDNETTRTSDTPEQVAFNGVTAISAGEAHSLFIKSDGSLWGMGDNDFGQLGVSTGPFREARVPVLIVSSGVTAVAAGGNHSLFIKSDGSLWAMGVNAWGQLGTGDYTERSVPVLIVPGQPPPPAITGISLSGANLILAGANGVSGEMLYTLMSTNLTQPLNQWQSVATNVLSADGSFTISAAIAVTPGAPQQFYILQAQ